jgi:hypothetical protein
MGKISSLDRFLVTRILSAFFFPIILMVAPVLAAGPEPKCGVDMPHTTASLSFDPTKMEKTGAFLIEGGLYREGEVGTCVAVHIECLKKMNQCDMVEVMILKLGPYPEIGPINLTDPMRIAAWTKDGLTAAGDTHLCQPHSAKRRFCPPKGTARRDRSVSPR